MATVSILLFDDQLTSKSSTLSQLYTSSKSRPNLKRFLGDASDTIHAELQRVLADERHAYGKFADILQLANHHESCSHLNEAVGTVLTTTIQVAELILLADNQPGVLDATIRSRQIGVSVGLIAAAVAATAGNVIDVMHLGLECVAISFRLGIALWRRARLVEDSPKSWGCTITGMHPDEIQERLRSLNRSIPLHKQAYIGVQADSWCTLFAPPFTTQNLLCSTEFDQEPTFLPSATALHASHLPPLDVETIVGNNASLDVNVPPGAMFSSSTCEPYAASDLKSLLHLIVDDIAQRPVYLETALRNIASSLKARDIINVKLIPVGPTHSIPIAERGLQRGGVETVHISQTSHVDASKAGPRSGSNLVAIVGMSGRFPDSDNVDDLWNLLQAGKTTHRRIPESRFAIEDFYDSSLESPTAISTEIGCFLNHVEEFDNLLFNISPREALQMDPTQRMLLMTTYEALQMAGYSRNATTSTLQSHIATFLGQSAEEWKAINDQEGVDTHYIPGTMRSFAPGRINHFFHFSGGITSVDTSCSASATAVHLACKALLSREIDTAIAGGGHIIATPALYSGLSKGGFLSTGPCKTFADDADGYCRGEAVGVVILKRLEDAVRENDNVLAVINGTERNSNAGTGSITFPSSDAQVALYRQLLYNSNTKADEISFVEMHGTGTQAGDAAEMSALLETFGGTRSSSFPLHVGALKAAIGHAEGAAGISALIKAVLMLQKRAMPPQPDWPFKLNQNFGSLENAHVNISDGISSFGAAVGGNGRCKIIVNSFDAAGGNVSMLLEEAPARAKITDKQAGCHHIVAVSGRTSKALSANETRLKNFLCKHPDIDLASLAYTTTARRMHELNRSAYVVQSISELTKNLGSSEVKQSPRSRSSVPELIFTFTGQGSLYSAPGCDLYQTSPLFKSILSSFQDICDSLGLSRFLDVITGSLNISEASQSQLQLSLVALEVAIAQLLGTLGLKPAAVVGHSLGECAALCVSGVLSVADMLYLVHTRASLVEKYCQKGAYSMLAVSTSANTAKDLLYQHRSECSTCEIACLNTPDMTVISGETKEVAELQSRLKGRGLQAKLLPISHGYHSSQMEPILDRFEEAARGVCFSPPAIPVASTLLGETIQSSGVFDALYLRRQMRESVDFRGAVKSLEEEGLIKHNAVVMEMGPSPVCNTFLAACCTGTQIKTLASLRKEEDSGKSMANLLADAHVAGLPILWRELYKPFESSVRLLDLPTYAFDSKNYWVPYKTVNDQTTIASDGESRPFSKGTPLPYTCLQSLESLQINDNGCFTAIYSSKTAQSDLLNAIRGHSVNGIALCPASVFMEMAHTATTHILSSARIAEGRPHLQVTDLQMFHALLVQDGNSDQTVRITCERKGPAEGVSISFTSTTGTTDTTHGTCRVLFGPEGSGMVPQWTHLNRLIQSRLTALRDDAKAGPTHRMSKSLFYRLFGELVDYDKPYQSVKEAYISSDFQDAAAVCSSSDDPALGYFTCNPFALDGIVHLAGFILNADLAKDKTAIHIANRIESFQLLKRFAPNKEYKCYATIREQTAKGVTVCDVYLFDEEDLVAVCNGINFQKISREMFSLVIGQSSPSKLDPAVQQMPELQTSGDDAKQTTKGGAEESTSSTKRPATSSKQAKMTVLPVGKSSSDFLTPGAKPSQVLFDIVAAELGMRSAELTEIGDFESAGVDSMMSIKLVSLFKQKTGRELPGAFFQNHPTLAHAEVELDGPPLLAADESSSESPNSTVIVTPPPEAVSRAVLIQGDPNSTSRPVFLLTDGRGSTDAFVHLAPLPNGRRFYALESPFIENPAALYTHSIPQLAPLYILTIRAIQPRGPYILVGRSSGGAYAYEVAYQLSQPPYNETISGVIIVDMRVPRAVPQAAYIDTEFVARAWGVIVERTKVLNDPDDLAHSTATIRALYGYEPTPFPARTRPEKRFIIWAKLGVNDNPDQMLKDDGVKGVAAMGPPMRGISNLEAVTMEEFEADFKSWFWGRRETFGVNKWDTLLGDGCKVKAVDGDHFCMMIPPYEKSLSAALIEAVEEIEALE